MIIAFNVKVNLTNFTISQHKTQFSYVQAIDTAFQRYTASEKTPFMRLLLLIDIEKAIKFALRDSMIIFSIDS